MQSYGHLQMLFLSLLLAACQAGLRQEGEGNLFRALAGGEFVLHRDISIRAGVAHISFQDGTLAYGYNEFAPHCDLQSAQVGAEPQTITAGTYRIGGVVGIIHYVSRPDAGVLLAANGDAFLQADASSEWYMFAYHMALESPAPLQGLTLICGGAYNYPFYARYPSLREIQQSLGSYATIQTS